MANQRKKQIVSDLLSLLQESSHYALIQFENVTHSQIEELKNTLREHNTKFSVIKNSLFQKAVNTLSQTEKGLETMRKEHFPLKNKTALLLLEKDFVSGLKAFYDAAKDSESFEFKFGYVEESVYGADGLKKLAQLPGREELIAKVIGSMKSPMIKTVRSMKAPMQKLVFVLSAKAKAN